MLLKIDSRNMPFPTAYCDYSPLYIYTKPISDYSCLYYYDQNPFEYILAFISDLDFNLFLSSLTIGEFPVI